MSDTKKGQNQLNIELPVGNWEIQLLDNSGKIVVEKIEAHSQEELQVAQLPRGLYYLRLYNGTQIEVEKIILQ